MRSSQPNAATSDAARPAARATWIAAACVAAGALALYHATLLPGVDFGDTGSFQTTVGSAVLTPRVGYPLYFAIGGAFLRVTGLEPARALNLVTAIEAAVACGLFVVVAVELAGSLPAAVAGAALMAISYTFWSQAVTAEVYALHLALMLASMLLVLRWERRPTMGRLAWFFACYAVAFGDHLSTILNAPALTLFLLASAPGGWRSMLRPRIVLLAVAIAALGASQYLWNVRSLWFQPNPPDGMLEALRVFWFDVTKADWRDTMVLDVPQSLLRDHVAMYWFDLRQQFGVVVPLLAVAGAAQLWSAGRARAVLMILLYAANVAFAFSYNVGDAHVFYLPSHLVVALLATVAVATAGSFVKHGGAIAAGVLAAYAGLRGFQDYPALDRSGDNRPTAVLRTLTDGIDDQHVVMLVDLNWQVANGLSYFGKSVRPDLAIGRARDVLLYAPALVRDNEEAGRRVVASEQAQRLLDESYGPLLSASPDVTAASFSAFARTLPIGVRYAVTVIKQSRDMPIDRADLTMALESLGLRSGLPDPLPAFVVVAGVTGSPPVFFETADRPFRRTVQIDGTDVVVRMESWMASDTIRRMGFGHVTAGRHHTLIAERGISLVTFDASGAPTQTSYFAGIFAQPRRYLISAAW